MLNHYQLFTNQLVSKYPGNGVATEHLAGFKKTAEEEDAIIMIRGVSLTTPVLSKLGYPAKPFEIKAKSSNSGPHNGFVPSCDPLLFLNKNGLPLETLQTEKINLLCQEYSISLDKVNKSNNKIDESKLKLNNNEMILEIKLEYLEHLINNKLISDYKVLTDGNLLIKSKIPGENQEDAFFYLEKQANNNYKVYYSFSLDNNGMAMDLNNKTLDELKILAEQNKLIHFPLPVHCVEVKGKKQPIIPDYDLQAVFWKRDKSIKHHQPPLPVNSFSLARKQFVRRSLKNTKYPEFQGAVLHRSNSIMVGTLGREHTQELPRRNSIMVGDMDSLTNDYDLMKISRSISAGILPQEDPQFVNVSEATIEFLNKLNRNLGFSGGLDDPLAPVRHNFESNSPFPQPYKENLPILIFLPNDEILSDFIFKDKIVNNKEGISYLILDSCSYNDKDKEIAVSVLFDLLEHFVEEDYYIPPNCFLKETAKFGLSGEAHLHFKKLEEQQIKTTTQSLITEENQTLTPLSNEEQLPSFEIKEKPIQTSTESIPAPKPTVKRTPAQLAILASFKDFSSQGTETLAPVAEPILPYEVSDSILPVKKREIKKPQEENWGFVNEVKIKSDVSFAP